MYVYTVHVMYVLLIVKSSPINNFIITERGGDKEGVVKRERPGDIIVISFSCSLFTCWESEAFSL